MTETGEAVATGFKEWSLICDALTDGVQTIILRKGGIHEGRGGFEFKHREFFLFPTWFHTQAERLRWTPPAGSEDPGYDPHSKSFAAEEGRKTVDIRGWARLEEVWRVTEWERVQALAPLHVWNEDVVRERFEYDEESCLHVALVRAFRLPETWTFPYQKSYGGCRSWVTLPAEGLERARGAAPAMDDAAWAATAERARTALQGAEVH